MSGTKRIIVAVSSDGVIGVEGRIPWRHPGDMRRFKRLTLHSTVIMGRLTFESMNARPLKERRNIVISRTQVAAEDVEVFADLPSALASTEGDVWFIGGRRIYEEAMAYADEIDVTYVPDAIDPTTPGAVLFPAIDPRLFAPKDPRVEHEDEPGLFRQVFIRRADPRSSPRSA